MKLVLDILIFVAIVAGTIFSVAGVLGYLRFPDAYTRLHATGKVGVFGTVLLLVAAALWTGVGVGRVLLLIILLMLAGPTTSHAIAAAAHRLGLPLHGSRDDLATQQQMSISAPEGGTDAQNKDRQATSSPLG